MIRFTVPMVPVSVNHYVKHTRTGHHYVTKEAKDFKSAVWKCASGRKVRAKKYEISVMVFLGYKQRLDSDNVSKLIGDGLVEAGVIHSDANVRWILDKSRDWDYPRTDITVRALG